MKRALSILALSALALVVPRAGAVFGSPSVAEVSHAITELDVERARELLSSAADSPAMAFERARLSLYVGDCDTAAATLSSLEQSQQVRDLLELSRSCARAVAASVVVEDQKNGIWLRLQNEDDRALVPFLTDVLVRAREVVERDIGTKMPRPLRMDLVHDLYTLSAISGLPLSAAETTGTVAVARWGRVTMLSPRAAPHGYPWEDTLAHELTHLAPSRATRDAAPLWLQEGLAKHEETKWRSERPFDRTPRPEDVARAALESGESVGVDKLGPSIAMLPTPRAASIAFAEVQAFIEYFIEQQGPAALRLFLLDLREMGDEGADSALRSVTGYDLAAWIVRFEHHLSSKAAPPATGEAESVPLLSSRELSAAVRLGDLLFANGAHDAALDAYSRAHTGDASDAAIRWRLGRALIALGRDDEAAAHFKDTKDVGGSHAGWYALQGRLLIRAGDVAPAKTAFALAVAHNPYLEDAACQGEFRPKTSGEPPKLPADPVFRALCEAARKIPRD